MTEVQVFECTGLPHPFDSLEEAFGAQRVFYRTVKGVLLELSYVGECKIRGEPARLFHVVGQKHSIKILESHALKDLSKTPF